MKNTKKFLTVIIAVIMSLSCVINGYAFDQNENESMSAEAEIVTHEALSGELLMTASVTTQCPACNHSSYSLVCGGSFNNQGVHGSDVDCSISSHNRYSQCRIWDRLQYKTCGTCTHEGCSKYNVKEDVGQHTESCRHTNYNDNNLITTCYY